MKTAPTRLLTMEKGSLLEAIFRTRFVPPCREADRKMALKSLGSGKSLL